MSDIIPTNRGLGNWSFAVYKPEDAPKLGPFKGYLIITKDHHTVCDDASLKVTLINIPSQNVAWVKLEK